MNSTPRRDVSASGGGMTRREMVLGSAVLGASMAAGCGGPETAGDTGDKTGGKALKRILILGAGFGGLETASGLDAALKGDHEITLVDRNDAFSVGFSKVDVLFGRRTEEQVRYRYADLRAERVRFVKAEAKLIDTAARRVETTAGTFAYDYLVIALGADLAHDATPGFRESGAHEFYSMAGAVRLKPVLEAFDGGTLLLGILGAPYKCPPAPYEVACQIHDLFTRRGIRGKVTMKIAIPGARPVPSPGVSDALEKLMRDRNIEILAGTAITSIDAAQRRAIAAAGPIPYDLFVGVPVHVAPGAVRNSKLVEKGFLEASPTTLETRFPGVYAIGDVAKIPAGENPVPKAGAFAEDAARTVVSEILVREGLASATVPFHALGQCFVEVAPGEVARISANVLGGPKPQMTFDPPAASFAADRTAFESSRRDRWFRSR